ncbi:MAG: hypothetical protein ACP5UZ_08015 [Thermoplasmata archaeon]
MANKYAGILYEKPLTRTGISFEVASERMDFSALHAQGESKPCKLKNIIDNLGLLLQVLKIDCKCNGIKIHQ